MTEQHDAFHDADIDAQSRDQIAGRGLDVRRVDDTERAQVQAWQSAVARGFYGTEPTDAERTAFFDRTGYRRKLGVYDDQAPDPAVPVATFAAWGAELSVPGGDVPACAISSVTVSPTHRRRGLLRSLMAGELRTAAAHGYPLAALTVSESTIYGRFGFAPAAMSTTWTIDVRRAGWSGPDAPGRVDFIGREQAREIAPALHERVRATVAGELTMPGGHWDRTFGTRPDAQKPEALRVVQYRSPEGSVDGLAVYTLRDADDDFSPASVSIGMLIAATDAAYAGLWRFFLSMDVVGTITMSELSVDEPLWWMITDKRGASIAVHDHHYLRVLDVPAALGARRFDIADEVALEVDDPLGIAGGTFVVTTDGSGTADVEIVDEAPLGIPLVRLGVAELSALLVGGVSAVTLARAGRLHTEDSARIARLFGTGVPPRLSYWY